MRRLLAIAAGFALAAAACNGDAATSTTSTTTPVSSFTAEFDPANISFAANLTPFTACDGVLAYFKEEALAQVGPYGLNGGPIYYYGVAEDATRAEGSVGTSTAGGEVPATQPSDGFDEGTTPGFSTTNTQVAGVDEPDIVKTDGTRILSIVDGVLRYVDVSGAEPSLLGELTLESGWGHRFFVSGDRAFVFSTGDVWGIPMFAAEAARIAPDGWGGAVTVIQEVDLSDPAAMSVVRTVRLDGTYLSARAVGDTVRVVISSYPDQLPFVYPSNPAAEDFALQANKQIIQESTIDTWLPGYTAYDADGNETGSGFVVDCARMHRPADFAGFDTLSVTTLDLGSDLEVGNGTGVIAQGQTVYASSENLYVATSIWVPSDFEGDGMDELADRYSTAIHKFSITGDGPAEYLASGSVDGHLLNQFAMDEQDGFLRVATTTGAPWGGDGSESEVVVLTERDGELVEVGSVGGLGDGEQIYSVRFIGDVGYVVTFRQVDPLYVIDLRDPENPAVTGELKIPGYSSYLHPLGNGMLLGVGQDADGNGRVSGAKATLFNVSDPANPVEVSSWSIPGGYSDVEWDHLAFLAWAPADIAVLPVSIWEEQFYGAVVLKTDDGLREFGRVFHHRDSDEVPPSQCVELEVPAGQFETGTVIQICGPDDPGGAVGANCEVYPSAEAAAWVTEELGIDLSSMGPDDRLELCWPNYEQADPQITRSLVIGDTLWTLSWRALQANSLDDLGVETTIWF